VFGADGTPDYDKLDRPTVERQRQALRRSNLAEDLDDPEYNYLDVPAFLRRQAD